MKQELCPICGEGLLHAKVVQKNREHKGFTKLVPMHMSVCDSCCMETATAAQLTQNKREMNEFYKEAQGLLTGNALKLKRKTLKLTQAQASLLFGGGPTAFAKYEAGDVTQSVAMDKLIRVASAIPEALDYLYKISDLKSKSPEKTIFPSIDKYFINSSESYEETHFIHMHYQKLDILDITALSEFNWIHSNLSKTKPVEIYTIANNEVPKWTDESIELRAAI
ncbi:type II toxin-antitoxin system MqsA family antitoxin [Pantoea ananatis]|uniref:type II toxin-antitoxin system MqsA family antitoxin n=1 Tax=Pantoea ananas TaxID=553 RepID=UPI0015762CB4|nr:type II toxin-antitoxin system MqsA family antitoxin [Pantoea ananatis]NQE78540.1 hypothetical protein [Pantoea ananatis]NQE82443.1 hypothetical protein [Pantoea ananatis]